jgi:hypothetical protein
MLLLTVMTAVLAAEPAPTARVFIAAGAKTQAQAQALLTKLKLPAALVLPAGYPKLLASKALPGLNPGFVLVVLGACPDSTAAQASHANGLAALIQRALPGAYAKTATPPKGAPCPLWLDADAPLPPALAAVKERPDDPQALLAAARVLDDPEHMLSAALLLRRAVALGARDADTLGLLAKLELLLEDVPWHLPP